ncbi:MAG TPA: DUF349 domain-containing protein [Pseudonocardiaceae bacterium]|jgi:hypothetical protein|nr:DUF349 domain-containing protein [Pseudonocardiaceae bacterium]
MTKQPSTQQIDMDRPGTGWHSAPDQPSLEDSVTASTGEPGARPRVTSASRDPRCWGRIDQDGTVYTNTAAGERKVASWQAGTLEEGLAHFARRFDDLLTEAELLESRLASGATDPKQVLSRIGALRHELVEPNVVGDLAGLAALLDYLQRRAEDALAGAKLAREQAKAHAIARKEALAAEAEQIAAESTQWKASGDRLRTILDEWKTIKGIDRKTDEALWRRFSKARDAFTRRRGAHFAELDRQRVNARQRKEVLVAEAEELADSTDWGPTAGRFRALMAEWKAVGRAPKEADEALWQRFRAAQDQFFRRRSATFSERDAELEENAQRKAELIAAAERIDPTADIEAARAQLRDIQQRWEAVGKVPRERVKALDARLRAVEDRVRSTADAQWRRTDPEAEARVAQFRERVEQYEAQAAKARAVGDDRRASAAMAQADQWREWLAAAEQAVASR